MFLFCKLVKYCVCQCFNKELLTYLLTIQCNLHQSWQCVSGSVGHGSNSSTNLGWSRGHGSVPV